MYVCVYVCIIADEKLVHHSETLRVTMKDSRAVGAKLLEGFKSAPDIWYHIYYNHMNVCTICLYVCMYVD